MSYLSNSFSVSLIDHTASICDSFLTLYSLAQSIHSPLLVGELGAGLGDGLHGGGHVVVPLRLLGQLGALDLLLLVRHVEG